MHLLFMVPLAIALLAVYVFENSAGEITSLAAIAGGLSFLFGIVLAPWQLQLIFLALVILVTRQLLRLNQEGLDQKASDTYCDLGSQSNPGTSLKAEEITCQYRGATLKLKDSQEVALLPSTADQKYRGASVVR